MKRYNVLLSGNLDQSVWRMAKRLHDSSCNVTIAASELESGTTRDGIRCFGSDSGQLSILYESGHFDTVIFMFSTKSEISDRLKNSGGLLGYRFDELRCHLGLVKKHPEVQRFYLVTDQRVFSLSEPKTEESPAHPESGAGRLIKLAEDEVKLFRRPGSPLKSMILRITHLYCPGEFSSFAGDFMAKGREKEKKVYVSGSPENKVNFLCVDDLTDFICLAMEMDGFGIVHLLGAQTMTNADFSHWLSGYGVKPVYMDNDRREYLLSGNKASERFNWYARSCITDDIEPDRVVQEKKRTFLDSVKDFRKRYSKVLPWVETIVGALIIGPLAKYLEKNVVFSFIDIRLLYAVLIGSVHGTIAGWVSGLLAYVSYCFSYLQTGSLWNLVLNMDNWIPFVFYLLAGGITGYVKSTHDLEKKSQEEALKRKEDDLKYLQEVHKNTCDVRDMLMEQVVKSRDSYGKIYSMVEKLNSMYSDEIMFRALGIYENLLANNTISIYIKGRNSSFIRKLVESNGLKGKRNSINLRELPLLIPNIESGSLFTNKDFLSDYPSYCMPLKLSNDRDLLILVWKASDTQWNKHYQNLIIIISKLALLSMDKAIPYQEAPQRYVSGTIFLKQDGFIRTWEIRHQMKLEKVNDYVLFRFASALPDDVLSERLRPVVRSVDVAGRMDDGTRYIIMTQASAGDSDAILKRLMEVGVGATLVSDQELTSYQEES